MPSPKHTYPIPQATFRLKLSRAPGEGRERENRWATFNPYSSHLQWEDNGEPLIEGGASRAESAFSFVPVSAENPGLKSHHLKLIKIQVGFGCNFSCGYCSQKSFRPTTGIGSQAEAQAFLRKFGSWYDGGEDGKGQGTRIEFLGGETLLYWSLVHKLARGIKEQFPKITFSLYTNGSIIVADLAKEAIALGLQVHLSHDGLTQLQNRGADPLQDHKSRAFLRELASRLLPHNLFGVQMTLGKANFALAANRELIAEALGVPPPALPLVFDIVYSFDDGAKKMAPGDLDEVARFQSRVLGELRNISWAGALAYAIFRRDIVGFLDPLLGRSSMADASQRCDMDKPSSIAVDLKGNVLTCQNTTASGGHKIGHLDAFGDIRLTTGQHWSGRENCRNCPVVSMCRGACMYTKDDEFQKTCDSMFAYYLSVLAFALENLVGWRLEEVGGENIRARGPGKVTVH